MNQLQEYQLLICVDVVVGCPLVEEQVSVLTQIDPQRVVEQERVEALVVLCFLVVREYVGVYTTDMFTVIKWRYKS